MTFDDVRQEQIEYHNIPSWHDEDIQGQGFVINNCEFDIDHGEETRDNIEAVAPGAKIISQRVSSYSDGGAYEYYVFKDNKRIPLEEYIKNEGIDIFTASLASRTAINYGADHPATIELIRIRDKTGAVFFNSAGNYGYDGLSTKFPLEVCISIGALTGTNRVDRASYSSVGEELDFMAMTLGYSGTSFSAPTVAGMSALLMQRYGKMNHYELYELLKMISTDILLDGFDKQSGHGVVVLPEPNTNLLRLRIDSNLMRSFGQPVIMDTMPFIRDSRTYVPVRFVSESLGAKVEWDGIDRKVTVTLDNKRIVMVIDSKVILVDGAPMEMDVAPFIRDNRTFVPIRFIAETLGMKVGWVDKEKEVLILG